MLIKGAKGSTFWIVLNERGCIEFLRLSDNDVEMVEKFGQSWVNFLKAADKCPRVMDPVERFKVMTYVLERAS